MFFCQWEKFQNTVRLIISHLEILVCVHEDFRFEIMYWKYKSATGYAQQKSIAKAKEAFEDILKILPDDYYRHLNHKIYNACRDILRQTNEYGQGRKVFQHVMGTL